MAIDFKESETLIPVNQNHSRQTDSGSDSAFIGSWSSSSSSSFLNPSFGSELDSNDADLDDGGDGEDDGDDFIAQLTQQMANYMLEENDDSGSDESPPSMQSSFQKRNFQEPTYNQIQIHEPARRSYADTVKKSITGYKSEQSLTNDKPIQPPIQMYQVEHQPQVGGQSGGWGRREKMSELTQHRHEQMHVNKGVRGSKEYVSGRKGYHGVHGTSPAAGSGMRAIFLGGSGSQNAINGTGVFLPRSTADATVQGRKKPGCSTVLVPTRVLQALEQHFNNMESLSPSNKIQIHPNRQDKKDKLQAKELAFLDQQKSKLPQEWTY